MNFLDHLIEIFVSDGGLAHKKRPPPVSGSGGGGGIGASETREAVRSVRARRRSVRLPGVGCDDDPDGTAPGWPGQQNSIL